MCRFLFIRCPEFAQGAAKLISHFITEVEFAEEKSGDKKEQLELREWLQYEARAYEHMFALGLDFACYGNGFGRIHKPFNRFLLIPTENGYAEVSVSEFVNPTYNHTKLTYTVDDPTKSHREAKHRRKIPVAFVDRVARDKSRIALRRIDPAYVFLKYSDRSGRCQVVERFHPWFLTSVKRGDLHNVNETPISMLKAIAEDADYLYNVDEIYHLKAPTISGISNAGWGLPMILSNFPNLHQIEVYRRTDEALGLDAMMPLRVMFPNLGSATLDTYANAGPMGMFKAAASMMIKSHRKNPFDMHAMPFPIGLQEIGASGKQFSPKESIAWQQDSMLNAMGLPAELYRGSMNYQTMPGALRVYENQWRVLLEAATIHMRWVVNARQDFLGRERMSVRAAAPRIIDDLETKHVMLQLAAGGEVPRSLAFRGVGIQDPVAAAKLRAREDVEIQMGVQKIQEDAARAANGGLGGPAGGAPGGVALTPAQRQQDALEEAKKLLQIPDDGDRAKQLRAIENSDPDLYALVKQKMEDLRNAARSQGGQQVAQLAQAA